MYNAFGVNVLQAVYELPEVEPGSGCRHSHIKLYLIEEFPSVRVFEVELELVLVGDAHAEVLEHIAVVAHHALHQCLKHSRA